MRIHPKSHVSSRSARRPGRASIAAVSLFSVLAVAASRGEAQTRRPFRFVVGAGTAVQDGLAGQASPATGTALHGLLGLTYQHPGSPVALRLDGSYHAISRGLSSGQELLCSNDPCGRIFVDRSTRNSTVAAVASGVYTWGRGRIAPYGIAGAGGYRLVEHTTYDVRVDGCPRLCPQALARPGAVASGTHLGLSGGAGLALRGARADLLLEVRYHRVLAAGRDRSILPMTVGLRF